MTYLTLGITFEYNQYYLPTKRHKKENRRKLVTTHDAKVRIVTEEEFPVALKVTDHGLLPDNPGEYKVGTIELRYFDGTLWQESRVQSGNGKGELIPVDCLMSNLKPYSHHYYEDPDRPYVEGTSVLIRDTCDEVKESIDRKADRVVIYDNKLWVHSGQPYYQVMTFGLGGNHGGTGFFINRTYEDSIPKEYFLATQKEMAVNRAERVAERRGDTHDRGSFLNTKQNIEILIPEAYTLQRQLEYDKLPGYFWDDDIRCYVKVYGEKPPHGEEHVISFEYKYENCKAILYTRVEDALTEKAKEHMVVGELMEDIEELRYCDITIK